MGNFSNPRWEAALSSHAMAVSFSSANSCMSVSVNVSLPASQNDEERGLRTFLGFLNGRLKPCAIHPFQHSYLLFRTKAD